VFKSLWPEKFSPEYLGEWAEAISGATR